MYCRCAPPLLAQHTDEVPEEWGGLGADATSGAPQGRGMWTPSVPRAPSRVNFPRLTEQEPVVMKPARYVAAAVAALAIGVGSYLTFHSVAWHEQAPVLTYTLLDGRVSGTEQLRGKVVLVNFWATSCATCIKEMPQIVTTYEKYKNRGYETVAVAMSYDPPAYVIKFAETRRLPFSVAIDNTGHIAKSFDDIKVTPTSMLINKRGEIVKRYVGEPDFAALHELVEELLAES